MARQLLLSDEEEKYLTEIAHANLKGLDVHDVIHGPCEASSNTRRIVRGLARKLGIEVLEDWQPPVIAEHVTDQPPTDLARMASEMQQALSPMFTELAAGRIERVAAPLFVRAVADLLQDNDGWPDFETVQQSAYRSVLAAEIFFERLDSRKVSK